MATKKAAKVSKKATKKAEREYHLVVQLNDQTFETDTDNLEESIQSFAPEFVKTKVVLQITKDGKTLERVLYGNRAKLLFQNRYALEALVRNLFF